MKEQVTQHSTRVMTITGSPRDRRGIQPGLLEGGNIIRLYGKNRRHPARGQRSYWTDITTVREQRVRIAVREPALVNVTSRSSDPDFRNLSPMRMGPVECYPERGRMVSAVSVEVAWQYSKVYSHVVNDAGRLVNIRSQFIGVDSRGESGPSAQWFAWRDAAFSDPRFAHTHPEFETNKRRVRRAFPKGSQVAFWYWDGAMLDAVQARQRIYAALYERFVIKTAGFRRLREIVADGNDLILYDLDGYDWVQLGMTPTECVTDLDHSFGHGMVIAFLLQNIAPTKLITN